MAKDMILKYSGNCRSCGDRIAKGTFATYNGRGRGVTHIGCKDTASGYQEGEPEGLTRSRYDRYGVYSYDGRKLGSTCNCEDYPCCGH